MEKRRNGQTIVIAVLAVAILFMSVGFAAFAQTLNINGEVKVEPTKWSVHWDTSSYAKSANSVDIIGSDLSTGSQPTFTNDTVTFGAKLAKPGDFAEFTIDAVNDGDFDAILNKVTLSSISAHSEYLTYTVKVGNQTINTTTDNLNISLPAGDSSKVTVTVEVRYVQPNNTTGQGLPTEAQTVQLTAAFDFVQAE
jgi:hypothetical protein